MKQSGERRSKQIFRLAYLVFAVVMAAAVTVCSLYVMGILKEYEANQPEHQVEAVIEQLVSDASSQKGFWEKYSLEDVIPSVYEKDTDIKGDYLKLYTENKLSYTAKNGIYPENELHYVIRKDKLELAEVVLKAEGEPITKLAVFSSRVWKIEEINPIFGAQDYTLQVPEDFKVTANGVEISEGEADENGLVQYTVSGVYREPEFSITDGRGNTLSYAVKGNKVFPEYYDYTLVLPHTLEVTVNGEKHEGMVREDGFILHEIYLLEKPEIKITDLFGNSIAYEGKTFDLTYTTILAPDSFTVSAENKPVPEEGVKLSANPEYELIAELVNDLPKQAEYSIAVLKKDAKISVTDSRGNEIEINTEEKHHDLMDAEILDSVPEEVSAEIDVLDVAQKWSLYMSNDFTFADISKLMLADSYQYKAAKDYSTSIDRTFFSAHTLLDPAFTENNVTNFTRITEDCFSVEVSFIKHMRLTKTGKQKDDPMNDVFYFVKSDGKWLFAAMKEVVTDGE